MACARHKESRSSPGGPVLNHWSRSIVGRITSVILSWAMLAFPLRTHGFSNNPPIAVPDTYSVAEDNTLTIGAPGVLANDRDPDGDRLTARLASLPTQGSVSLSPNGGFTYTPNPNFHGTDSFTYDAVDSGFPPFSSRTSVSITVSSVNDAPVARNEMYTLAEDGSISLPAPGVLANDTDADGDSLSAILVSSTSNGSLKFLSDGSFDYSPNPNFFGQDSFTYLANDRQLDSKPATVVLDVRSINDIPIARDDSYTVPEDGSLNQPAPGVLANDSDGDGDSLNVSLVSGPSRGTLSLQSDGSFLYTPFPGVNGSDSFTYRANDDIGTSSPATVSIQIIPLNDPPTANSQSLFVTEDTPKSITLTASDPDGDSLTYSISTPPTAGSLSGTPPNVTYTPNLNYNGPDSFIFTAADGGASSSATVSITVTFVNDLPVLSDLSNQTINEDTPSGPIPFTISDVETPADSLSVSVSSSDPSLVPPSNMVLGGSGQNRTLTITPAANRSGQTTISITVGDANEAFTTKGFVLTVNPVNDPPLVSSLNDQTINEDNSTGPIPFTVDDLENGPNNLTVTATSSNGSLLPNGNILIGGSGQNRSITLTPLGNQSGQSTISLTVTDSEGGNATRQFLLTVNPVNDPPTANNDAILTAEESPVGIVLTGSDPDGNPLSFIILTPPSRGILNGSPPQLSYVPNPNESGSDSFTFKVNDGSVDSPPATININIVPMNDPPVAHDQSIETLEDTPVGITLNGTDPEGTPVSFTILSSPSRGVLNGNAPNFTYVPNPNENGADSFTFRVNDGSLDSPPVTVRITIAPVNDPPSANNLSIATAEDSPVGINLTGTDPEGGPLTFTILTLPQRGTLSGAAPNLTYIPNPNANGGDSFTFKVNDGGLDSSPATVSITVAVGNDPPAANNLSVTTAEDAPVGITLTGSDPEGDPLTFTILTSPAHGTLNGSPPNLSYVPNPNETGPDSFTFKVSDGVLDSPPGVVSITISPVNDPPVANNQSVATAERSPVEITLGGSDPEAGPLTFRIVTTPTRGVLNGLPPNLTYTPNPTEQGRDSFTFVANDGALDSSPATVSIEIAGVNDPPVAHPQSLTTAEDTSIPIVLTGTDPEGSPLTFTLLSSPAHGIVNGTPPNLVYVPNSNLSGPDSFTFKVSDGALDSAPATVSINVTPVNDPPTANNQTVATAEDAPVGITLSGSDPEGSPLLYAIVTGPTRGVLTGPPPSLTYTPNPGENGQDQFTFRASDGVLDSAPALVTVQIASVNQAPTISDIPDQAIQEGNILFDLPFTIGDSESPASALFVSVDSQNAELVPVENIVIGGSGPNRTLTVFPVAGVSGTALITVTVTDGNGAAASDSFILTANPGVTDGVPIILVHPDSQTVRLGSPVSLNVAALGDEPLGYQWRLNGINIPGANGPVYNIPSFGLAQAGDYRVTVNNLSGVVDSQVAHLLPALAALPLRNNFSARLTFTEPARAGLSSNVGATVEPGEPLHLSKPGGHSMWMRWTAPATGIATFRTLGSSFDTLLAVYTGSALGSLNLVTGDDDGGPNFTSVVSFNAQAGQSYEIAVDGFARQVGAIVLDWNLEVTAETIPVIAIQPESQTVPAGSSAGFSVVPEDGAGITYQWFFSNLPLLGETGPSLTIPNVQPGVVGSYFVELQRGSRIIRSRVVSLEIGTETAVVSEDKFEDILIGGPSPAAALLSHHRKPRPSGFASVSAGSIGTQVMDNFGATTEQGEPNHGGVTGGSSRWFSLVPQANGIMIVDTIGSNIDTVLAVYRGTDLSNLTLIDSDDNSAPDGVRSLVRFNAKKGLNYLVAVDGVGGQQGKIKLNWKLGTMPVVEQNPASQTINAGGQVTFTAAASGIPAPAFQWQYNGANLPGATSATLTLPNLQPTQNGQYRVVVSNFIGSSASSPATLIVTEGIHFTTAPIVGGQLPLHVTGTPGRTIRIESSSNLINWSEVTSLLLSGGEGSLNQNINGGAAQQFFRAVLLP